MPRLNKYGISRHYLAINILNLFINPRLRVGHVIFCIGTTVVICAITSVLILLLLIGFGRVLRDISTQEENIKQGLQMIPNMPSRNYKIAYSTTPEGKQEIDQYVKEIDSYLQNYLDEQRSRWKYTKDCAPDEKPVDHWCSFPIIRFERDGQGCTSLNRYGYDSYQPCILFVLKDELGWKPQTKSSVTELAMKCTMYDRLSMKIGNVSYYAAFSKNTNYGAFPMNKIPSRKIVDIDGNVIMDELGEILYDLPGLLFIKLLPTPNFQYMTVTCYLTTVLDEPEIYNINELKGNKEFKFDIIFNVKQ